MRVATKFLILILFVNLSGCLLKDHEIPEVRVRLSKQHRPNYGTFDYNYDPMGRMSKETFTPSTSITPYYFDFTSFDSENRLLEGVENFNPPLPDLGYEVLRNSDGKINRIRKYCVGDRTCTSGIWYFTYPSSNTVEVKFWDNGSIFRRTDTSSFNAMGQITEVKSYNETNVLITTTSNLSFDDKRNLASHYPEGYFTSPNSNNNVLLAQVKVHATDTVTDNTYTYEYNPQGFVVKSYRNGELTANFEFEPY
jgi:hypothetical protein